MRIDFKTAAVLPMIACAGMALAQPSALVVSEFMASNSDGISDGDGDQSDWIEIANPTASAVSLTGCYLTDDQTNLTKWQFPASANISVPANGYLIVFASSKDVGTPYVDSTGRIHTSFKLGASGESVGLTNPNGSTVISAFWDYPAQTSNVSYGLGSNSVVGYFGTPTPGAANGTAGAGFVSDTAFSADRGFYSAPFDLTITTATSGATIRYTLDGSTPSATVGAVYTGPIHISSTATVRAIATKDGWFPTNVDTETYLFLATVIAQPATKPTAAWPDPYVSTGMGGSRQYIDYEMDPAITTNATYASQMDDALLAIPTISMVTDLPNLFDATTGIYMNPGGEGDEWERPASVELINPDGSEGFQVDGGIRIRGGVSAGKSNPKHSFRLIMRSDYGDSKIEYPLLGPDGPQSFDKVDFRTAQNYSWNFSNAQYATWLDDPYTRVTMHDMGHLSTDGFFFHLYINGIYWGMYQTEERPDAYFCQSHLGAAEENYDVVKSDEDTGDMYAVDGATTFYSAFWTDVTAGVTTVAQYEKLKGLNADGTPNAAYPKYLDEDNLLDYMLLVFFTGAPDMPLGPPNSNSRPRNLYAAADRVTSDGWKWIPHDNEGALSQQSGINNNRVTASLNASLANQNYFNPWWLHSKLKVNSEYLIRFADRVHRHFFNNGALTPAANTARYQRLMAEIDTAIIAESARWGDQLTPATPRTRESWLTAVNWVVNNYFNATPSTRTAVVLAQLRSAGLYPTIDAPEFNQHGGDVEHGFNLVITAGTTIRYTTDGSDPRLIGGAVNTASLSGASGVTIPLNATATVKARAYNGTTWSALTEATFNVSANMEPSDMWVFF